VQHAPGQEMPNLEDLSLKTSTRIGIPAADGRVCTRERRHHQIFATPSRVGTVGSATPRDENGMRGWRNKANRHLRNTRAGSCCFSLCTSVDCFHQSKQHLSLSLSLSRPAAHTCVCLVSVPSTRSTALSSCRSRESALRMAMDAISVTEAFSSLSYAGSYDAGRLGSRLTRNHRCALAAEAEGRFLGTSDKSCAASSHLEARAAVMSAVWVIRRAVDGVGACAARPRQEMPNLEDLSLTRRPSCSCMGVCAPVIDAMAPRCVYVSFGHEVYDASVHHACGVCMMRHAACLCVRWIDRLGRSPGAVVRVEQRGLALMEPAGALPPQHIIVVPSQLTIEPLQLHVGPQ
jgi:hypothetical protein